MHKILRTKMAFQNQFPRKRLTFPDLIYNIFAGKRCSGDGAHHRRVSNEKGGSSVTGIRLTYPFFPVGGE